MNRTTIIIATIGALAAIGGAWLTAQTTADQQVAQIETKVEVVKTTENLHYLEVKDSLGRIEKKLDMILK